MNMNIDAATIAQLQEEINAESNKGLLDKISESADTIRENLKSIKGEDYARLVEVGVLIHKRVKLTKFLLDILSEEVEDFGDEHARIFSHIDASMSAHILNHACKIMKEDADAEYAAELTSWIDRIIDAEQDGIDMFAKDLMRKED